MAEYFKFEIGNWNVGTDDLTLEQEAAYLRIISMIRLYEQPLKHNLRVLCGIWRCNERRANRLLKELIDAGKLEVEGGFIINRKAVEDASTLRQSRVDRASTGRLGGIQSGKSRRKALENKETGEAPASTREEKRREEQQQPREASQVQENRERLLTAMGADPVSGLIGPNGTRLGSVTDMAEAEKWSSLGIKPDDQCRLISERCEAMRRKNPNWAPRSFGYFSGLMADFASKAEAPVPSGKANAGPSAATRDQQIAKWHKIASKYDGDAA